MILPKKYSFLVTRQFPLQWFWGIENRGSFILNILAVIGNSELIWVLRTSLYLGIINHSQIVDYEWQNTLNSSSLPNAAVLRFWRNRDDDPNLTVSKGYDIYLHCMTVLVWHISIICVCKYIHCSFWIFNSVRSNTFPETKITSIKRFVIWSWSLFVELDGRLFTIDRRKHDMWWYEVVITLHSSLISLGSATQHHADRTPVIFYTRT